jgi:hypothetical protein
MLCQEFEAVLEQASGQPLPAEALAHVAKCGACQALTADFDQITSVARQLREPDTDPPARVWQQLRAQLQEEGILKTPQVAQPAGAPDSGWFAGVLAWMRRPALVATYAGFMVLAAGLAWQHSTPDVSDQTNPGPAVAVATENNENNLNELEARTMNDLQNMDPEANAALRHDLQIVDNFIAVCEQAVREQPQDEAARQYLYGAYQQKSELLAAAMVRGRTGD